MAKYLPVIFLFLMAVTAVCAQDETPHPLPFAAAYQWGATSGDLQAAIGYAPGYATLDDEAAHYDQPAYKPVPLSLPQGDAIFLTVAIRNVSMTRTLRLSEDVSEPQTDCRVRTASGSELPGSGFIQSNGWMGVIRLAPGDTQWEIQLVTPFSGLHRIDIVNVVLAQDPPAGHYTVRCTWFPSECIGESKKSLDGCASTRRLQPVQTPLFEFTVTPK